jgi:heat shock protein HtpX
MLNFRTMMLVSILTALFMFIGFAIGGKGGVIIAFLMAFAMNFFAYWNSDKIVLKMNGAKIADEVQYKEFYDIVKQLIMKAGTPMPKLYVMSEQLPNAFATGRNPGNSAIAITEGIWNLLSKEELSGVIAHELAHIIHRDTLIGTISATFAGAISMIANMFMFSSLFGGHSSQEERSHPLLGVVVMLVAPVAATIVQMAVSRQREYMADELGGKLCNNPLYLASALTQLENYSKGQKSAHLNPSTAHMFIINPFKESGDNLFSTHPNTTNRVNKLQLQAKSMGVENYSSSKHATYSLENADIKKNYFHSDIISKQANKKESRIDANVKDNPWL